MAPGELRDQLRSLRIDREEPPRSGSSRRVAAVLVLATLVLGGGAFLAYRIASGGSRTVSVAYARLVSPEAPAQAAALSGSGYVITAEKYIAIGVRVPGRIERFLVDEGDHVRAGQPLAELDDRDYRAQVGRAEAALRVSRANRDLARSQLERVRQLFQQGITSKEEMDQAESRYEVAGASAAAAENELTQARVNLEDTVLRSPVDGVVLAKLKGVGEIAVPGGFAGAGDLLRIADLSELRAEVDVSEVDLRNVRLGQEAEVVPDAFPQERYRARVVKLYPQVNRQKGTLKVEVRIENPDARLLPDMSARVSFLTPATSAPPSEGRPGVLAPRAALRRDAQGAYVWTVSGGELRRQPVRTGVEAGDDVEIVNGLDGGEALVIGPDDGLREGARVEIGKR
jgi:RND family efflux transporter MFP subunit